LYIVAKSYGFRIIKKFHVYVSVTGMVDQISQAVDLNYHSVGVFVDLHTGVNSY